MKKSFNNRIALEVFSLAFLVLFTFYYSYTKVIEIPMFHIDGAFQTGSALYRINEGYLIGRDFFPYLGIAINYILYPFFSIFGSNLAASQLAAYFVTQCIGILVIFTICRLAQPKVYWRHSALFALILHSLFIISYSHLTHDVTIPFWFQVNPGVSLRPTRAFAPYFFVLLFLFSLPKSYFRTTIFTLALSLILLWSNDYAYATYAFAVVLLILFWSFFKEISFRQFILPVFLSPLISQILLFVLSDGHNLAMLKYNFSDVAVDQWWYFGPYDIKERFFGLSDIYKLFPLDVFLCFVFGISLFVLSLVRRNGRIFLISWISGVLFLGGAVGSVGGHIGGYFDAFVSYSSIVIIVFLIIGFNRFVFCSLPLIKFNVSDFILVPVVLFSASLASYEIFTYYQKLKEVKDNRDFFYVQELGGYLPSTYKSYVELARNNQNSVIIEEYWGLFSAINRQFSPWKVDSVIHALGHVRAEAKASLENHVDKIITTNHIMSLDWQPWIVSENYWLYEELFRNWKIETMSPTTIVWSHVKESRTFEPVKCSINGEKNTISIATSRAGYYSVNLNYELNDPNRKLLLLQNNISYAIGLEGYVSVNPSGHSVSFPVYFHSTNDSVLESQVVNGSSSDLNLFSCTSSVIPDFDHSEKVLPEIGKPLDEFYIYSNGNAYLVSENHVPSEFYLTDTNWVDGFARYNAGYILPNIRSFRNLYLDLTPGSYVKLPSGELRNIISISASGIYINVGLDGPVITKENSGLQHLFDVVLGHK